MPSPFVEDLLKPLDLSRPPSPGSIQRPQAASQREILQHTPETTAKQTLRSLLVSLNRPLSDPFVNDTIGFLMQLEKSSLAASAVVDAEEGALKQAIIRRLVVSLYSESLDICISQAIDAETEAEWWADVLRSRRHVAWYLLQTIPSRLVNLMRFLLQTLRIHDIPVRLSAFSPASLRQLFPTLDAHRSHALTKALFPHINIQSFSIASSTILFAPPKTDIGETPTSLDRVSSCLNSLFSLTNMPMELGRQECTFKRRELEKIRDHRAEALGRLAQMRGTLALVVKEQPWNFQDFLHTLGCILAGDTPPVFTPAAIPPDTGEPLDKTLLEINRLSRVIFTSQQAGHQSVQNLRRPSRLTLLWPKLLLLPPLCIYVIRSAYISRATLVEVVTDAKETLEGFVTGWLIEPLKEVLKTIRAGGEDGVIVRKEGVAADLESLERMTLSLAKDRLNFGPEQLATLCNQIKVGDLTPVLELYEEDIKQPLRSALSGTLLRSMFIQVQKAKVDIDQALAGIDKLLRSQELTFGFVGVAPAFAIIYIAGGSLVALLRGTWGIGKYGGKRRMGIVWSTMRRTERLLVSQPGFHDRNHDPEFATRSISPLTTGLLLLSVTHLRRYAETCLPARSRLREGFLEDVGDLENPDLGRAEKMRVVERMWRCWGEVLGWRRVGAEGGKI